jgi:hypothetical protein
MADRNELSVNLNLPDREWQQAMMYRKATADTDKKQDNQYHHPVQK